MMKKLLVLSLTLILVLSAFASCTSKQASTETTAAGNGNENQQTTEPAATEPSEKVENVDIALEGKWEAVVNLSDISNAPLEGTTRYYLEFTGDQCKRSVDANFADLIVTAVLADIEKDATANGMTLDEYFAYEGTTRDACVAAIRAELGDGSSAAKTDTWKIEGSQLIIGENSYDLVKVDNFNIKLYIANTPIAFTKK